MQTRAGRDGGKATAAVFLRTVMSAGMSKEGGEESRLTLEGDDGVHEPSRDAPLVGRLAPARHTNPANNSSSETVANPVAASLIP
jgi:hypothetical protein